MRSPFRTECAISLAVLSLILGPIGASVDAVSGVFCQTRVSQEKAAVDDKAKTVVAMTVEQLLQYYPAELSVLKFSSSQEELDSLLRKVGESVDAYFRNFRDTASKENVLLERLKADGKIEASLERNYDYLVMAHPDRIGVRFEEDRRESKDQQARNTKLIGYCLTSGYTGTPILFHPRWQSGSSYRYLGRQSTAPRAYVIAFAQKPEAKNAIGSFRMDEGSKATPLLYQGLIWVDPQTYQIVRLRADLLAPMPDISLLGHTTEILFGGVHFSSIPQVFWLPQGVTVTIRWKGKTYRNLHRYSDYRLFSVKSFDKLELPQIKKRGTTDSRI